MTTAIIVSLLVPIAAAVAFLFARNRLPKPAVDSRGIALQTIIVIVVLLAIAGAVAAVLINRAGEETGRLTVGQADCEATDMGGKFGVWASAGTCTWTATAGVSPTDVTRLRCSAESGKYTASTTATGTATCVYTP